MKTVFSGLESSGKSLKLAMILGDIVWRNYKWKQKSGIVRPIYSNLKIAEPYFSYATEELGIPIHYWSNIDELVLIKNADVFVDEIGNYFDSRLWSELSLDARRWLSQGAKAGVEIYATCQDFAQVDKAFRRLVNVLLHIVKVAGSRRPSATKPPVSKIWGMCMVRELDPRGYDEDEKKQATLGFIPSFFFIRRQYCDMFDTSQIIERSKPESLKHTERKCLVPGCEYHRSPKIVHA